LDETQLINYMKSNNCMAKVGKPDTMEAAAALERRGMIEKVGSHKGQPIYHMTDKAIEVYTGKRPAPVATLNDSIAVGSRLNLKTEMPIRA